MKGLNRIKQTAVLGLALLFSMGLGLVAALPALAKDKPLDKPTLVVLSASWCATCREIDPVVRRIVETSPELGLKLVMLDVDSGDAPASAGSYGITVAGSDVPQVYLFSNGKTVLLFSGRNYRMGQSAAVESQIRSQLKSTY